MRRREMEVLLARTANRRDERAGRKGRRMLTTAAPFDRLRDEVERLMAVDEPFEVVERAIADTHVSEDRQAALWLVAWSHKRRRDD